MPDRPGLPPSPKADGDEPDVYCRDCGNDDRRKLAFLMNSADAHNWRCKVCGREFSTAKPMREE